MDLLVVTKESMPFAVKREIIEGLLTLSNQPCPLEVSFLRQADLVPWEYPTPFDLHYSEMWRDKYQAQLATGEWRQWNEKRGKDPDLAAHITIVTNRGICLWGKPITDVFPSVPAPDYLASILSDYREAQAKIIEKPVYAVLTSCRVYAYLLDQAVMSKQEAAIWGIEQLPEFRALIEEVLGIYQGDIVEKPFDGGKLQEFNGLVKGRIGKLLEIAGFSDCPGRKA